MSTIKSFSEKEAEIVGLFNQKLYTVWPTDLWDITINKTGNSFGLSSKVSISFTDVLIGRVGYLMDLDGEFKSKFEAAVNSKRHQTNEETEPSYMDDSRIFFEFSFEYLSAFGHHQQCFVTNLKIIFEETVKNIERSIIVSGGRGLDLAVKDALEAIEHFFGGKRRNYVFVQVPNGNVQSVNLYKLDNNVPIYHSSFKYNPASSRGVDSEIWTHLTGKRGYFYNGVDNIYLYELYNR